MDINTAFKISAGVTGQQAVDRLGASVKGLHDNLGGLAGMAKTAGGAILAAFAGGLTIATLKTSFDDLVTSLLDIKDASERTGASFENISKLSRIAEAVGEDFGTIESAMTKMTKALAGSDDESKGAAKALDTIGLSIRELRAMDPAEAFGEIAKRLEDFEDGAGKTALVMDIFGKSGAQIIPFLHDYNDLVGEAGTLTKEQAEQADQYDKALKRLTLAKKDLTNTIGAEALPVLNAFVKSLVDAVTETDGVKSAAQGLAADGSLQSVFMEAARAAAALLDIMADIVSAVKQVGDSFGVVWKDISTAAKVAGMGLASGFTEEGQKAIRQALDERNAYVEAANKRLADRISNLTPFTDRLELQFKRMKEDAANPPKEEQKRSLKGYQSRAPSPTKTTGADPFGDAVDSLGQEAAKLREQIYQWKEYGGAVDSAKEAQVRFQVEQGKFKDLSQSQKDRLLEQAKAVDQLAQQLRDAKVEVEVTKQTKAIEANTAAMGLNTREREMAAFAQDLENKGIQKGTELYDKLTAARRAALESRDDARLNPFLGLKEGLAELEQRTADVAGNVKNVMVGAFDKASDALTDFVMTGKLNFKDFAKSVIRDITNMIIKQMLFNALKAGLGGTGFGAMLGFKDGGAFDGGKQFFANGGVVSTATPFRFASGGTMQNGVMGEAGPEAIMPLKRGKDGKLGVAASAGQQGGGVSIGSIVVQNNGEARAEDTSGRNGAEMGRAIASAVQAEIIKQQRPGGLLYAA